MADVGIPPVINAGEETWQDRVKEGAYTPPSKTRIKFQFEDLRRTVPTRGTAFDFDGVDDQYVQRKGFGSRQYPLRCYFTGANCDREADAFMSALLEYGVGKLEHPRYGTIPHVVPFGDVGQRDDLKTAANQSIVDVTFWTTLVDLYPSAGASSKNEIERAVAGFDVQAAQAFADSTDLTDATARANLKATIRGMLDETRGALQSVADMTADVKREFDDAVRLVNESIDVLIGQPVLLAQQLVNLVQAPARAVSGIESRLTGYVDMLGRIFGTAAGTPIANPVGGTALALTTRRNDVAAADLFALAAVSGSVLSATNNNFETRPGAIVAAESITSQFDSAVAWRDGAYGTVGAIDTGASYQALHGAVALVTGYLVETSFSLTPERSIVLDRARTILDVSAQIYQRIDPAALDLLISSNRLTGSEILELPKGRRLVYYP